MFARWQPEDNVPGRVAALANTFIRHPDGTCSAAAGANDDTVMAMAIAQAVRAEIRTKPASSTEEMTSTLLRAA